MVAFAVGMRLFTVALKVALVRTEVSPAAVPAMSVVTPPKRAMAESDASYGSSADGASSYGTESKASSYGSSGKASYGGSSAVKSSYGTSSGASSSYGSSSKKGSSYGSSNKASYGSSSGQSSSYGSSSKKSSSYGSSGQASYGGPSSSYGSSGKASYGSSSGGSSYAAAPAADGNPNSPAFYNSAQCRGREEEWVACEGLPSCQTCVPQDCMFDEWMDWFPLGGCTGLCVRKRMVREPNNECGHPCEGSMMETMHRKDCYPDYDACVSRVRDCTWEEWRPWSNSCKTTMGSLKRYSQRFRKRNVKQVAVNGGKPCIGSYNETEPCTAQSFEKQDCILSEWAEWTPCSATCGGGWHARMRRVTQHAMHGGSACFNTVREQELCNIAPCGSSQGCVLGEWTAWEGCDLLSPEQQYRTRAIVQPPHGHGPPCNYPLRETEGCEQKDKEPMPCLLSEWAAWSKCSAKCGGQKERARRVPADQQDCVMGADQGRVSLHETEPCGASKCVRESCKLSEWGAWSQCSQQCGEGIHTRERTIQAAPAESGCDEALEEVKPCINKPCQKVDCRWAEWDSWSACSCTCGGGSKRRNRIVASPPRYGGLSCEPMDKSQIIPCNTQSCKVCIDGMWGMWAEWSKCSATCEPSYRSRHRSVERHPNQCGMPAVGSEDEYEVCGHQPSCATSEDCLLGPWQEWTSCSCKCFGVRERLRVVLKYAKGKGKPCESSSLKQVQPCDPGPGQHVPADCAPDPKTPCKMADWEEWAECSATCGGGLRKRSRSILQPAAHNGPPCDNPLEHIEGCNMQSCARHCIDCEWGIWSDWGDCTKCGGQRYRHRAIERMPNHCGRKCDKNVAKEVGRCVSHCTKTAFCVWSSWEEMGGCSAACGPSTKLLQRSLHMSDTKPVPKVESMGGSGGMCRDARGNIYTGCAIDAREQRECSQELMRLSSIPGVRGAMYDGNTSDPLGKRRCFILVDPHVNVTIAAVRGGWMNRPCFQGKGFGAVASAGDADGRSRTWNCLKLEGKALLEGDAHMACSGSQVYQSTCNSKPCEDECIPQDCMLGAWSHWSDATCTQLCQRSRTIAKPNSCGGKPCGGKLIETKRCWRNCSAKVDCKFADWSFWEPLECLSHTGQRQRERTILENTRNGGKSCTGPLRETLPCSGNPMPVTDCVLGEWIKWTECNRPCGNGLSMRSRIIAVPVAGGGVPCRGPLGEMKPCTKGPCKLAVRRDATFSAWGEWTACNADLLRTRSRTIEIEAAGGGHCGRGATHEIKSCNQIIDCVVSDWTIWDKCDKSCGGGQQRRQRQVTQNPRLGGKPCPKVLIETRGCDQAPCKAIDCEVSPWSKWGHCSAHCGNGYQERKRSIEQLAEKGGSGCELQLSELQACEGGTHKMGREQAETGEKHIFDCPNEDDCDCVWGEWTDWSSCTCECNGGQKTRNRHIAKAPGPGCKPCAPYPKEQIVPCNTHACASNQCIDAQWGAWQDWEPCSASCKGGITWRTRRISRQASECGKQVSGLSEQHAACNSNVACILSQDCVFGHWTAWSGCSQACDGVKRRSRTIDQPGRGNGKFCLGAQRQTYPCSTGQGLLEFSSPALYMHLDSLKVNNLDGKDPRRRKLIRYVSVTQLPGEKTPVDIVVKPHGNYKMGHRDDNGLFGSCGSIGTAQDSTAVVDIHIVEHSMALANNDREVKAKMIMIKLMDISDGMTIKIDGYDQIYHSPESQVTITEQVNSNSKSVTITAQQPSAGMPHDPMSLDPRQEEQSVSVLFKDTGHARIKFTPKVGVQRKKLLWAAKGCFRGDCMVSACGRGEDSVDCVMHSWAEWGTCDAQCGKGQKVRSREVRTMNSHGGRPCHVSLTEMAPCESKPCQLACTPRNCTWAEWGDWSACDKCGGQQKRFRHIRSTAACGGNRCEPGNAEVIAKCPRKCHELSYCVWGEWGKFAECTTTCGSGIKSRARRLKVVNEPLPRVTGLAGGRLDPRALSERLQVLEGRAEAMEAKRSQQLAAAFSAGFLGLVAMLAFARRGTWSSMGHDYAVALTTEPASDGE